MKTTKSQIMKHFGLVAIIMAAITLAACSSEDSIIGEQHGDRTFTLIVSASKGDDAATRALTLDGTALNATWAAGEAVTVFNVTRNADLTGTLTAQSSGTSTTLQGSLTGTIEDGDELKLKFLSPTYGSQDGTLATIASTCDYAEATVTVTDASTAAVTTTDANFVNQQAIIKFTLKDKATDAAINVTKLTVTAGATTINVTPASATDVLYVAIPAISSQDVTLTAKAGSTSYTYVKSGATIAKGQFYGFTVSMDAAVSTTSVPLTFEAKTAGAVVTFTAGTSVTNPIEYSTDGITWTTYTSPITLTNVGDKVSFRGDNAAYGDGFRHSNFGCSKGCYIYGNIMSLITSTGYATATELTNENTFYSLFGSNENIYNHPSKQLELPATTLTNYCYAAMFSHCTNLTIAPELPATKLADYCYQNMFDSCTSLNTVPELSATTMADGCYWAMFLFCTNLTTIPELPATILKYGCYHQMFAGCTSLTIAPELPATTLAERCYGGMFGSTGLRIAPELPAITLADHCYAGMFAHCKSLTTASSLPATTLAYDCYGGMYSYCTSLTTAPELPATTLAVDCYNGMFSGCTDLTLAPELPATTLARNCYEKMFYGCTGLATAPELPATKMDSYCYKEMFRGCTSLTTAPELPATKLAGYCYYWMFSGCTSLTTAPTTLPATKLLNGDDACYYGMFQGCTSLTTAPELPATILEPAWKCYAYMFYNCTSLTTAPELPAMTITNDCYHSMFSGCTNLTTAPELPATKLAYGCYQEMFNGCTNLNSVKCLATDISATDCTTDWLKDVPATGTFTKAASMTSWTTGDSGIPSGWTVNNQ